jgi:hypothetical protein
MRVKLEYKDCDLNIINVEEYTLENYCHLLSQRTLSLLFQIEELLDGKNDFQTIKHFIFDLAGSVSRIPENILDSEQSENIKMKPPDKGFFSFLKRGS